MSMLLQICIAIASAIIVTGRADISQLLSTTIRRTFIDEKLPNILQRLLLSSLTSMSSLRIGLWFLLRTGNTINNC